MGLWEPSLEPGPKPAAPNRRLDRGSPVLVAQPALHLERPAYHDPPNLEDLEGLVPKVEVHNHPLNHKTPS